MTTYEEVGVQLFNLGTSLRWVVSFTPRLLYPPPVKSPGNPLDRSLGGTQNQSERGSEERKKSLPPPGIDPLSPNPVA
jgi:hypothetical protein